MFERILGFSIARRWLVVLFTAAVAVFGAYNYRLLPIDAVPDITTIQVQVNTEAPGYSPFEVEQRITVPLETAFAGLPALDHTRSLSRYGLSQITVVFEDGTDIYFARQLISERLQGARESIPSGLTPGLGPIATGLGEIFMYTVTNRDPENPRYSPTELRTIQDWVVKPQLKTVPGVVDVNTIGGYVKQYQVSPKPERLMAYNLGFSDLVRALTENNRNVGAGYIERSGEQYLVRSPGQVASIAEIEAIPVSNHEGTPILVKDIATVAHGVELRTGAATENGQETVLGTVFMLMGENSRTVSGNVAKRMEQINHSLPEGSVAETVYDRTNLVNATIGTVKKNLFEGAVLVIAVLFFMLGNFRAALITACVIPLAMLFAISGMVGSEITGNLMSLGALDFGLIVDGSVILVENCVRRLAAAQRSHGRRLRLEERLAVVFEASVEVRKATMFGEVIIMIVYLPILTLAGVEGKMFHPMAYTVLLALTGAMIFSLTFVPAAVAIFVTGDVSEEENVMVRGLKRAYAPILRATLAFRAPVVGSAILLVALSIAVASRFGTEFMPNLDEGDIALHALRIPGTSLTQAVEMQHRLEERIRELPEVKQTFAKIGTAEIATDPMPPSVTDGFVMLKPRSEWPDPSLPKSEFVARLERAVKTVPGNNYEFMQPIQMRFNELIAGVRSDVAVKVFGDDPEVLLATAQHVTRVLASVRGASDVKVEQVTGLPFITMEPNREKLKRFGIPFGSVQDVIEIAVGGKVVGQLFEGDRRFEMVVRSGDAERGDIEFIKRLPVPLPDVNSDHGGNIVPPPGSLRAEARAPAYVPLGELVRIELTQGPNQVTRENGKRRVVVTANVRGRDLGSFVSEAEGRVASEIHIPAGYWIRWGGQFEQLISAKSRLQIVVPLALLLIFLLLYTTLESVLDALIVFSGVPFALTGGIFALYARGLPFSITAAIGFIALSGVAVLNGLVMVSFIGHLRTQGRSVSDAVLEGSIVRLRPVLMTALVASLGFVPMALSAGVGSEVQRPLATVVIGGILSSTFLTLLVLPALYRMCHGENGRSADR